MFAQTTSTVWPITEEISSMQTIALRGTVLDEKLTEAGAKTNLAKANLLGLTDGTISRVLAKKADPGPRFIAAALTRIAAPFDELFEVVDICPDNATRR